MSTNELRSLIEKRHGEVIAGFRRKFLDEANRYSEERTYEDMTAAGQAPPGIGPLRSVVDRHATVTLLADLATLSYASETPGLTGYMLTLSVAGHHRVLDTRVTLSVDETDAWLYAVLGDDWADHSYHAGARSGVGARLSTVFYLLYLDENFQPIAQPVETYPGAVPVKPEMFPEGQTNGAS